MENNFCSCERVKRVYTVVVDGGHWDYCVDCEKPLEDGFHYEDEIEHE